jgi:predicted phage tail protein
MLRAVYLHGALGRRYGHRHHFDIGTLPEAIWALEANYPGFRATFMRGPAYSFVRGSTRRAGRYLDLPEVVFQLGKDDVHIIPAAMGRGGGGGKTVGKIVLGVAMIAGAFFLAPAAAGIGAAGMAEAGAFGAAAEGAAFSASVGLVDLGAIAIPSFGLGAITYGNIAGIGALLALSGVSQLLSPNAQAAPGYTPERPEARQSFIYSGAVNTAEQGGPIPIVYGRMRVGSTLAASAIGSDEVSTLPQTTLPDGGTARTSFDNGDL